MTAANWFFSGFAPRHTVPINHDTETIEQLRNDLYEAHKTASIWKHAYEELDEVVETVVKILVATREKTPKGY